MQVLQQSIAEQIERRQRAQPRFLELHEQLIGARLQSGVLVQQPTLLVEQATVLLEQSCALVGKLGELVGQALVLLRELGALALEQLDVGGGALARVRVLLKVVKQIAHGRVQQLDLRVPDDERLLDHLQALAVGLVCRALGEPLTKRFDLAAGDGLALLRALERAGQFRDPALGPLALGPGSVGLGADRLELRSNTGDLLGQFNDLPVLRVCLLESRVALGLQTRRGLLGGPCLRLELGLQARRGLLGGPCLRLELGLQARRGFLGGSHLGLERARASRSGTGARVRLLPVRDRVVAIHQGAVSVGERLVALAAQPLGFDCPLALGVDGAAPLDLERPQPLAVGKPTALSLGGDPVVAAGRAPARRGREPDD